MKIKFLRQKLDNNFGFTLIELLVVIAIIAILAGLSFFTFQNARMQARDAKRRADLETIRSALELFKADCGVYPSSLPNPGNPLTGSSSLGCTPPNSNIYIQSIPGDPSSSSGYSYSRPTPSSYVLCSTLEDSSASAPPGCGTCNPIPCRYRVQNP